MTLKSRNTTGSSVSENGPQLPEGPQWRIKSWADRLFINLGWKDPGPKNLGDRKFIKTVEKAGKKAQDAMKDADEQLVDWNAAADRYDEIVKYVAAITADQTVSVDKIIETQQKIEKFQEQLEMLIGNLQWNDATILAKLKEIKENTQRLWDDQKQLEKLLKDGKGAPKAEAPVQEPETSA